MQPGLVRALVPVVLLLLSTAPSSQRGEQVIITGRVTDAGTTRPIADVSVSIRDTRFGATSNQDGLYRLTIPAGDARGHDLTLIARRIGYVAASRAIHPTTDTLTMDIALSAAQLMLESVVVTAAQSQPYYAAPAGNSAIVIGASPGASISIRGAASLPTGSGAKRGGVRRAGEPGNTEAYDPIAENPFLATTAAPRSTFSIDVDHASYSNVRRFLVDGNRPPRDAVRLEELINYFPYELPAPRAEDPVSITTEVAVAPWNPAHRLVRIGLRGRPIEVETLPPNNLVFLIDVSGSMQAENKLPLLKSAFRLLVNELRPQDRVALVVYAGQAGLVLPSTPGTEKERILEAIAGLEAGGSTAGGAGIRLAYDVAKGSFIAHGNNRVILATDGDFNVGVSSDAEMVQLIEERREQGTFLTVLGFGTGNVKDAKMEKLADKGNGNYAYVDNIMEARKVLVTEMGGTLVTVAKDVKLQVEFNPARVGAYRLLGYENRLLRDEDFADDRKDAGELGAGHSVTALYELIPPGSADLADVRRADPLRYSRANGRTDAATGGSELLYVKLRYKQPTAKTSREMTHVVQDITSAGPSTDFAFASAVAEFGMVLRGSPHAGKSSMDSVIVRAERSRGEDANGYRAEFVRLARIARDAIASERVAGRDGGAGRDRQR